jgi:hypothetical protein
MSCVEGNGGINVVDHVTNVDGGHRSPFLRAVRYIQTDSSSHRTASDRENLYARR